MKKISLTRFSVIWLAVLILFKINIANAQNGPIVLETEKVALVLQVPDVDDTTAAGVVTRSNVAVAVAADCPARPGAQPMALIVVCELDTVICVPLGT